jgi:hypothetical protein
MSVVQHQNLRPEKRNDHETFGVGCYGLKFDHLGLAVRDPEPAKKFLSNIGYQVGSAVCDPLQQVNLTLCRSENSPDIEIVYPSGTAGPLDNLFRTGREGIYHACYNTANADLALKLMREDGLTVVCVKQKKPAVLFRGDMVSFYHVVGFGLIEVREMGQTEKVE